MKNRSVYLACVALGFVCASVCASAEARAGALLSATIELEDALAIEAARSERGAQAFGASLSAADRRELQGACTALVANPSDAAARRRLELMMSRYRDNNAAVITRYCLEPAITQLRSDLQASQQALERLSAAGGGAQADIDLQNVLQKQQQTFTMISNIMKTKHDTAKNSISNVR